MILDKNVSYRILTCCGCGNGTCTLLAGTVSRVMKELGIQATVEPAPVSVGTAQWRNYDMVFCNRGLVPTFSDALAHGAVIIGLKNVMSADEIKKAIAEFGNGSK